ncbi:MAG: hypothetical protein K5945_07065 [Bacteroidaceae bacterium]|nr:hypothetical protein [Bacteroidaceae bacterium]
MAKRKFNKYLGTMTIGALIMATPSCSDYDDHYFPTLDEEANATETLWEKISTDPNLTRFADILQHAQYYKDDTHPVANYTYADVLSSGQVCTVWAPENDYFTEEEYKKWLEMAKTNGYNLEQQLVRNHIALWRHNLSGTEIDTIKMFNSKNLIFDRVEETLEGVKINRKNIPALNGVLHTLKGKTPFEYNFYEYIKYSGELPLLHEFFIGKDTTYFNPNASIEGLPDKNGNPTYVDSIYTTSNLLINSYSYLPRTNQEKYMSVLKGLGGGSNIQQEDSMYIMILPSDAAWTEAYERLKPLYNYAPTYENRNKGNVGTTETMKDYNVDSLMDQNIKMDLTYPLLFNIHKQPKIGGYENGTPWTLETFIETKGDTAEYFYNTYGDTIRSSEDWNKTELFNGQRIKMSNGYAYKVDKWAFPLDYYMAPVIVEVTGGAYYYQSSDKYYTGTGQTKSFSNSGFAAVADKYGKVSRDNFYLMKPKGTTHPKGEIKLHGNIRLTPTNKSDVTGHYGEVMSGKYDIYIVMVPYWYTTISEKGELDSVFYDSLYVDSVAGKCKNKFKVQLRYNNGAASDATTTAVEIDYDAKKVDTIKVLENFKFPYSYKDLRFCYPTMIVQGSATSANLRNGGYIRELCIDQVILRGKEEDSEPQL